MMRIALGHIDSCDDRVARFAHQLGLRTVQLHTPDNLKGEPGYWEYDELQALQDRCRADGLPVEGLENVPAAHFWKVQRRVDGRDGGPEYHVPGSHADPRRRRDWRLGRFRFEPEE